MSDAQFELVDLTINEGSLVSAGDNPEAHVKLFKNHDEGDVNDVPSATEKDKGILQKIWEWMANHTEENVDESTEKGLDEVQKELDEVKQKLEAAEKERDEALEAKQKLEAAEKERDEAPDEAEDEMAKALKTMPEPVRKEFESMRASMAKMEAEKARNAAIEKAKDIGIGEVEKVADVFEYLSTVVAKDGEESLAKKLETVLRAAKAQAEKGEALLKVVGSDEPDGDSPAGKLDSLAKERAKKDGVSYAIAYKRVADENKELFQEARASESAA